MQGDNWLGVALAALMKIPRDEIAAMGTNALRKISQAPLTDHQRYLLWDCVEAYLPLDDDAKKALAELINTEKYSGVKAMNKTTFEKGEEKGEEKGRRDALTEQLEERFGPLSIIATQRLQQLSLAELIPLCKAVLHAQSLSDLGFDK